MSLPRAAEKWPGEAGRSTRATEIFGWTTESELQFLQWYAETRYTGAGAFVELGSLVGRSTVAMLEGLAKNPRARGVAIDVYDLMRFDWFFAQEYPRWSGSGGRVYAVGDSFEALFWESVGAARDAVRLHAGDIEGVRWTGGPIEFLFVDIMKSWSTAQAVIAGFFPALEPGLSLLVQQDYKHPFAPQILLTMYRLRDAFEPAWSVTGGGSSASVAFRPVRKLTAEEIDRCLAEGLCDLASYRIGEIEAAIELALAIVAGDPEEEVRLVKAARAVLFLDLVAARSDYVRDSAPIESLRLLAQDRIRPYLGASPTESDLAALRRDAESAQRQLREAVESKKVDLERMRATWIGRWLLRRAQGD